MSDGFDVLFSVLLFVGLLIGLRRPILRSIDSARAEGGHALEPGTEGADELSATGVRQDDVAC